MGSRMLLMLIVTAGAAGGGSTGDPAPAAAAPDGSWREIAELFHRRLDEEGVVGGSLWMVQRGDVVHRELHGWADLETRRRVDDATIYHWASITKTVTAIAVLQLRDRGLLSLDDPAVRHVPELREVHSPWGPIEDVT
ncbi:MAG: beta-lactamase family protein, partial [Gemmatimonadetes bacterium]|nr:beta-lactamase family protein [Gemmatimonadota bacterium]